MPNKLDLTGNIYGELTVVEMLYNYSIKKDSKKRTYCRCIGVDGTEVIVRADALRRGSTTSTKGAGKAGKPLDVTNQRFGLLVALSPTNRRASNGCVMWDCVCDCGNHTVVPIGNLTRGHTMSCGCRHQSKYEMMIDNFLTSLNINFECQKRFNECRNKSQSDMLPFDFYLPDYNLCIEYDGEHHFKPVNGWGGYDKFIITQENDKIKNDYCLTHQMKLLRLPYTFTEKEIKSKILNTLSPVTTTE